MAAPVHRRKLQFVPKHKPPTPKVQHCANVHTSKTIVLGQSTKMHPPPKIIDLDTPPKVSVGAQLGACRIYCQLLGVMFVR
jgi:hypothetical protein